MLMQRIRDYINQRRHDKLLALNEQWWNLTEALSGISYLLHPFDYEQVEAKRDHVEKQIVALEDKLTKE